MSKINEADHAKIILKRIAVYLDGLAGDVADLEDTVSDVVKVKEVQDERAIKNLQSLDFLRQSLEDLARMAAAFGESSKNESSEALIQSAASKLKLKSSRLLLGDTSGAPVKSGKNGLGEIDLF
ncbi:hypothetical protein [uncultured Roseobacter sp.]|uniref:hypothetical protein n=1 Tax=uncultured Roseobacter sp. TaxID=114847 RepID=UPI0026372679|nr:hypothetical protein [uncultured Roseobacter sp.]